MILTQEQQSLLDGAQGETMAKVVKTLVMYGEAFGAQRMVPITNQYGHTVISFGIGVMKPVYELYDQLLGAGMHSMQPFSADPRPLDKNVPSSFLQDVIFKFMYSQQSHYEQQLRKLGLMGENAYTCACYLPQVGNVPKRGEILSWAESSAVVYANSVLGARCNRNSGIIELMGSIAGFVPEFGLLTDDGRRADWIVQLETSTLPDAQLLGSAVGMKVLDQVPFIRGLDRWLGDTLDERACTYFKDFGAACASNGSVGLYHVEHLTPEAVDAGQSLIRPDARVYVIDDAELARVRASYPCIWKKPDATPKLCFIGCPHMTLNQLCDWTDRVEGALAASGNSRVLIPTVFTAAPDVIEAFSKTPYAARLAATGVIVSYICPLMYMNNPLSKKMPVITSSNKLRTYTSARFYSEEEILSKITKEGK